jgi:sporulation protein YlmC with PRC-barrel domain
MAGRALTELQRAAKDDDDPHLRSVREVTGYHIQGTDGEIGHVDDLIVDDTTWAIRYLVIDTRNWWLDRKVLVAPHWADRISWDVRKVYVNLKREQVKHSPEWHPDAPVNREYEARLYDYYGRPTYWRGPDSP